MNENRVTGIWGPIFLVGAFTLAGTSVVAAQMVTAKLGTFTIAAVSLGLAILVLLPLSFNSLGRTMRGMTARGWLVMFLQAVSGIFLFRVLLLQGLLRTSAGEAGILTGTAPAITALLARVILKEPLRRTILLGVISTLAGIWLIEGILVPGEKFSMAHFSGNLLVLGAAICESLFSVLSRLIAVKARIYGREPASPLVQTTLVCLMAWGLCLIPAFFEHPVAAWAAVGLKEWLALAWYGVVVTALGYIFWYAGIKRCGAYLAAAFSGLMPLVALLLSMAILGESYSWRQWSGGVLVILGILFIGRRRKASREAEIPA
jgi:drug/metabolite transporter (DMT)-like permease